MKRDLQKWWIKTIIEAICFSTIVTSILFLIDSYFLGWYADGGAVITWFFMFLFIFYTRLDTFPIGD